MKTRFVCIQWFSRDDDQTVNRQTDKRTRILKKLDLGSDTYIGCIQRFFFWKYLQYTETASLQLYDSREKIFCLCSNCQLNVVSKFNYFTLEIK